MLAPPFINPESLPSHPQLPNFLCLNDNCIYTVMSYLDFHELINLSLVCRRLCNLCVSKCASLTQIELDFYTFVDNIRGLLYLLSKTNKLRGQLSASMVMDQLEDNTLRVVHDLCPRLESLDLHRFLCSGVQSFNTLSRFIAPNLTRLILKVYDIQNTESAVQSEEILSMVLQGCKNLEYLVLAGSSGITGDCFKLIRGNQMRYLDLKHCSKIRPEVIQSIFQEFSETLTYFSVMAPCLDILPFSADQMYNVKSLAQFHINKDFDDSGIESIEYAKNISKHLKFMPNLKVLHIYLPSVENEDADYLHWKSRSLSNISIFCSNLVHLDLSNCHIENLELLGFLTQLQDLNYLNISNANNVHSRSDFDGFIQKTLSKLVSLETLICRFSWLYETDLLTLIQTNPYLQKIDITDAHLTTIDEAAFNEHVDRIKSIPREKELVIVGKRILVQVLDVRHKLMRFKQMNVPKIRVISD